MTNTIKKKMSEFLYRFPRTRFFIRRIYQITLFYLVKIKHLFVPIERTLLHAKAVTESEYHCFFGYYDKCPWDSSGDFLLYHRTSFANRMPKAGESAQIRLYDFKKNKTSKIAETKAWCWQQGCMLQWLKDDSDQILIYNDFQDGKYISVISNLHGVIQKTLPLPVYAVSKDSKQAVSLNFERLDYSARGYGYVAKAFVDVDNLHPKEDGIWHIDIETGKNKLIISLDEIVHFSWKNEFKNTFHYFNHLEFNPNGTRIVFLHRWFTIPKRGSRIRRSSTRMFTANPDGSDLYLLADNEMVSHLTWKDDRHLLAWANHPSAGRRYYLFKDRTNNVKVVGDGILTEDGHPSYSADHRWILTDTYPGADRMKTLILFNTNTYKRYNVGRYYAPFRFDGYLRCDLHPRWSPDGRSICFDSVHEGKRNVYFVNVSELLK